MQGKHEQKTPALVANHLITAAAGTILVNSGKANPFDPPWIPVSALIRPTIPSFQVNSMKTAKREARV